VARKPRIRRSWTINPRQRPHSTKKGTKGYDRKKDDKKVAAEVFESEDGK
jgi:hypothetical protein